nr:hypothetical protein Itr_chr11CG20040 [Ipomoea trifida]GMD52668.1 hypothetical protein Iba_chr11bCG13830 [Ipomoea batatas]
MGKPNFVIVQGHYCLFFLEYFTCGFNAAAERRDPRLGREWNFPTLTDYLKLSKHLVHNQWTHATWKLRLGRSTGPGSEPNRIPKPDD